MNKQLLLIILLVLQSLSVFIPTSTADYIIEGDKVYIDDEYVYLSAEPHTIIETTDVVFELISKQFGGEIDAAFGINNTLMSVSNPRLWNGTAWNPLNKQIQVVNQTHQGYNRWYLLKNVNINEDVLYRLKLTVDVVFNTSGKYFFGVKRSIDPITAGYYLDPWWDGDWDYKKLLHISNNIDDYSMLINVSKTSGGDVNCSGHCNDNFSDIRFVHDNTSVLPYWREYISTGNYAFFWVNNSYNDSCIELYYGDSFSTAIYIGDGTGVFINFTNSTYQQYWDFGSYSHKTENNSIYIYGEVSSGGAKWDPVDYAGTDWVFEWSGRCLYEQLACNVRSADGDTVSGGWRSTVTNTDNITYRRNDSNSNKPLFEEFYNTDYYIWKSITRDDDGRIDYYIYNETRNGTGGSAPNVGFYKTTADGDFDDWYMSDGTGVDPRIDIWIRWMFVRLYAYPEPSWGTVGVELQQTDVLPVTNITANTTSLTSIMINWTMGINSTHTHIRRGTTDYPSTITDGTLVYNSTGVSCTDSSLTSMTVYYYTLWAFNSTRGNWSGRNTTTNFTGPANPTSVSGDISTNYINISWTNGTNADNTLLVHNATAYPSSISDGNLLVNNTLSPYYNDTTYHSGYYTLFSWNNVTNLYSTGYQVQYGSLTINVYDENTSVAISGWDVFITNEAGTETYESDNNTNPLVIDIADLPTGDNVAIKINATYYDFRLYYMDIEANNQYTLNAYLPEANISELYLFSVVDEVDNSVSDATMQIQQYINETAGYENVSIRITDANGQVAVYLIPGSWNSLYKVIISKTGYETEIADYVPSDEIFTHTFRLDFEDEEPPDPYVESEEITFEGYISGTTLYVNYTDNLNQTTSSQMYIYEINYSTLTTTLHTSNSATTSDSYQVTTTINISNAYIVYLHYNHTTFGYMTHSLFFEASNITTFTNQTFFDSLFDLNYGSNPFGWSNVFMWLFLCGCFFSFGQRGAGISLMFTGGLFLFINYVVGFNTVFVALWSGGIPILFIITGIMVLWRNAKREAVS